MSKKVNTDDLADLSEPLIDETSRQLLQTFAGESLPALVGEIPIAKTALAIGKVFNSAKEFYRTKMMLSFLQGLQDGTKTMDQFLHLDEDNKSHLRGLIVSQLDMQTDVRQAEAIGYIVDAYLRNDIDLLTFNGVVSEIKNTNPLLYYFNVDSIIITQNDTGGFEATGPVELVPPAFGHNTITGIGLLGSTGEYKFVLSKLGQAFFEYVYTPMSTKYEI